MGAPTIIPSAGSYDTDAACGALTEDRREILKLHDRFDFDTFVGCLGDLHRRFGRIVVLQTDNHHI